MAQTVADQTLPPTFTIKERQNWLAILAGLLPRLGRLLGKNHAKTHIYFFTPARNRLDNGTCAYGGWGAI